MHDTPLTQVQAEGYLPQIQPRSPSLAQQLIHLLQQVLVFTQESATMQARACRPRGRPPLLPLQQLYLALLMGVLRQTPHLSTIGRRLYLEEIGTFAPVQVTYEAVRKRLLSAGTTALAHWSSGARRSTPRRCRWLPSPRRWWHWMKARLIDCGG